LCQYIAWNFFSSQHSKFSSYKQTCAAAYLTKDLFALIGIITNLMLYHNINFYLSQLQYQIVKKMIIKCCRNNSWLVLLLFPNCSLQSRRVAFVSDSGVSTAFRRQVQVRFLVAALRSSGHAPRGHLTHVHPEIESKNFL
jgi:hypothetical protein